MADEQFTAEDAQKLFEQAFNKESGTEKVTTAVVEEPAIVEPTTPTPEVVPEKTEPTPTPEPEKPAPVVEENKEDKEKPAAQAPTVDPKDPYAWVYELPEAQRELVLKEIDEKFQFKHRIASDDGRVRAFQQKLLQAQKEISELRGTTPARTPAPAAQPPKTPEGWDELAKADPEIAKAVEARVKSEVNTAVEALKAELQEFKKSAVDPLYEHQTQQYVEHERAALKALVPNVEVVTSDPFYRNWLATTATPDIKEKALKSLSHLDAIDVLQAYANDMVRLGHAAPPEQRQTRTEPTPKPPVIDTAAADAVKAERDRKLNAPAVVSSSTPTLGGPGNNNAQFTPEQAEAEFQRAWKKLNTKT